MSKPRPLPIDDEMNKQIIRRTPPAAMELEPEVLTPVELEVEEDIPVVTPSAEPQVKVEEPEQPVSLESLVDQEVKKALQQSVSGVVPEDLQHDITDNGVGNYLMHQDGYTPIPEEQLTEYYQSLETEDVPMEESKEEMKMPSIEELQQETLETPILAMSNDLRFNDGSVSIFREEELVEDSATVATEEVILHTPQPLELDNYTSDEEEMNIPSTPTDDDTDEFTVALEDFDEVTIDRDVDEVEDRDVVADYEGFTFDTPRTEEIVSHIVLPRDSAEVLETVVTEMSNADASTAVGQKIIQNIQSSLEDAKSIESRLGTVLGLYDTSAFYSDAQRDIESALKSKSDAKFAPSVSIGDVKYKDPKAGKSFIDSFESGRVITGKENAIRAIAALSGGLRKVHLYNSGFWIDIKAPDMAQLVNFQLRLDSQLAEYGGILGGLLFSYRDLSIRKASLELIKGCIISSNLEKWSDNFEECLSTLDYQTCLWGLATLMYPEGMNVEYVCYNKDCKFVDKTVINLIHMRTNNYSKLHKDALIFTHSDELRTVEDLTKYRTTLLNTKKKVFLDKNKTWSAKLEIPNIKTVIHHGEVFLTEMIKTVQASDLDKVTTYENSNFYKMILPYLGDSLTYTDPTTKKSVVVKDYGEYINELYEYIDIQNIKDYIHDNTITYFGYPYTHCPKCGKVPDSAVHSVIPEDMQRSFFIMTEDLLRNSSLSRI